MRKKKGFFLIGLLVGLFIGLFTACKTLEPAVQTTRKPSNFRYLEPGFSLPDSSTLRTDGVYFRLDSVDTFGDQYQMFRFYEDGLVIQYQVYNTPEKVAQLDRNPEGNIYGYYKVEGEELKFTTKVYYAEGENHFKGEVFGDSIRLWPLHLQSPLPTPWLYYFYPE